MSESTTKTSTAPIDVDRLLAGTAGRTDAVLVTPAPLVALEPRPSRRRHHGGRTRRAHNRRLETDHGNVMIPSSVATAGRHGGDVSDPWGDTSQTAAAPAAAPRSIRHPGDLVRAAAGGLVVAAGGVVARQGRLSNLETDVFRVVNNLPGSLTAPLQAVMQAGSLAAVPVAGVAALAARKPRLARDVTLSGVGAWLAAKAIKTVVGRGRPGALLQDVVFHGGIAGGLGFPSGHAAVAAALATAAGAYLGRRGRRAVWAVVAIVGIARIFVGAHLPVDVVGGVALGWAVGALVHLLLGVPDRGVGEAGVTGSAR